MNETNESIEPPKKPHPGQPTKYKPEYCEKLIKHMSKGLGYMSFGASIGHTNSTVHNWEKDHPEFLDAKEKAFDANRLWWDDKAARASIGKIPNANATLMIFNLKNRFPKEWRDRKEIDVAGSLNNSNSDELKKLSPEDLQAIREIHERARARDIHT
jgi:transposase